MAHRIFFSLFIVVISSRLSFAQLVITSTGVNNNFSVTYPANLAFIPSGFEITFFPNHTITTGGASLNVNGLGAFPIVKNVNQPLNAGEIMANQAVKVIFSTLNNWQMVSAPPSSSQDWTMLGNTPDSNSNYLGTNNLQPLLFYTNGVERMRISRQGRFGFNMNISSAALMNIKSQGTGPTISVFRSSDTNPIMEFRESGGGNGRIDLYNGGNLNTVQIPSGNGNIFFAGGGNLGINTTTPGNTLHVAGGIRIGNLTSSGLIYANTNGDLYINTGTGINIWTISGTNIVATTNTMNLAMGRDGLAVAPLADNSIMLGYDGGEVFYELHSGDMSEGLLMHSNGSYSGIIKNLFAGGVGNFMTGKQSNTLYLFNRAAEPILIETNNTTRMSIGATGVVGIKNLTSTGNFFVQANPLGDLFISTNTGQSAFWALGGNSVPGVRTIGTSNNFDIPFITNNIERMRINSLGRIGINTSTPGVLLDIKGTSTGTSTAFRILDSNNAASFNVLDNGATGIGTAASSGYQLYLNTATADPNYISLYINNLYSGVLTKYGIFNNVSGDGSGTKYCLYNNMDGLAGDNSSIFGNYNNVDPFGTGIAYGSYTNISPVGTNVRYGNFINVTGAANNPSNIFGNYISVSHQSTATGTSTYVLFGNNTSNANGAKYGVFIQGEELNYYSGNLGLGVTAPTEKLDVSGNTEVTGEYKYATPKTRYKSLSAGTFVVESNAYYLNQVGSSGYILGGNTASGAAIYANLDLPDNSTITGLYIYGVDNSPVMSLGSASIYQVESTTGSAPTFNSFFNVNASTAASSSSNIILISNLTDTPLVVDNDTKSYMVVVTLRQNTSLIRIVRARVRYLVPNAD